MRTLVIVGLCIAMNGCFWGPYWDLLRAKCVIVQEQAAIIKLYRGCLEKNQDDPVKAKSQCEHYTQSLQAIAGI